MTLSPALFKQGGGITTTTAYRSALAGVIRGTMVTRATATLMIIPITGRATTIGPVITTTALYGIATGTGATGIIATIGDGTV